MSIANSEHRLTARGGDAAASPYLIMMIFFIGATYRIAFLSDTFALTPSPFGCAFFLAIHLMNKRWSRSETNAIVFAGAVIVFYPIFTSIVDRIIGGPVIPVTKFFSSYGLWVANFGMMAVALIGPLEGQPRALGKFAYWALVAIAGFGVVQSLFANLLGSGALYNIWGHDMRAVDFPASHWLKDGIYRATSFFYEPSIFGRCCVCLCATCFLTSYRPGASIVVATIGAVVSLSAGAIVMQGCIVLIWCLGYSERPKKTNALVTVIIIGVFLSAPFLEAFVVARLDEINTRGYVSGFVRVMLPLVVVADVLRTAPLGAPVGSNAIISQANPIFDRFSGNEDRVTSGVYEFIEYTGYIGILLFLGLTILCLRAIVRKRWREALVLFVMTTATIVSSSFLAFESTIQLLPLLVAYRIGRPNVEIDRAVRVKRRLFGRVPGHMTAG